MLTNDKELMEMLKQAVESRPTPAGLLEEYQAGASFFLASPKGTILAQGEYARVSVQEGGGGPAELARRAAGLLAGIRQSGYDAPLAVGAIPFDSTRAAYLTVPETVRKAGPLDAETAADIRADHMEPAVYDMEEAPEPSGYMDSVGKALKLLEAGRLRKVVLSRSLRLASSAPVDVKGLLLRLAKTNTKGYTFAVNLPQREPDRHKPYGKPEAPGAGLRTLIGASPELLVEKAGFRIRANPLAGSAPRSGDPAEDERRAQALLTSPKDRHEHEVVVEAVARALRPFCKHLEVPAEPSLVETNTMWHLSTVLTGELLDPFVSSLLLAAFLHPTPAVCGAPAVEAKEAIRELEPFERGYFTGMVGWCDANGDGEWVVTIRCAEVQDRSLQLFAGAGIVVGSTPEAELAETSAKLRTMLLALGLSRDEPLRAGRNG